MSDPPLTELAILQELGDDLKQAFRTREAAAADRVRPRVRLRRHARQGGLAVAVVVAAILAFAVGIQPGHLTGPSAATARALSQAADAANRHPLPFPRDDQFYYLRTVTSALVPIQSAPRPLMRGQAQALPKAIVTFESRLWFSATRTGTTTTRVISTTFPTAAARRRWERLRRPSLLAQAAGPMAIAPPGGARYLLGNIELTRQQLLEFPTDPRTLYSRLYAAGGSAGEVFTQIGDALRNRPAPAPLRAALFRGLAFVPGIRFIGKVTDHAGRSGTAIGLVGGDGLENELIFDPRSSEMLAERTVIADSRISGLGLPVGTITAETTYLQRAVTDATKAPR